MRKNKALLWLAASVCMLGMAGCPKIKYEDDIGQLNSAQANSMEYPVKINGKVCKDSNNQVGLCAFRTASDKSVVFHFDPRPYSYTLDIKCSSTIDSNYNVPVEKDRAHTYTIAAEKFRGVRSFTCNGEVFPHDRNNNLSASWSARVVVVDDSYQVRERIYWHKEGYLVLGKYAKYSVVCTGSACKAYSKATVVEAPKHAKAFSESEVMRFNYYGH